MLGHLLRILFKNDDFMNAVGLLLTFLKGLSSAVAVSLLFINNLLSLEVLTKLGKEWVGLFIYLFILVLVQPAKSHHGFLSYQSPGCGQGVFSLVG